MTDSKNIVGSVVKAARLLNSFSVERPEVTLSEFTEDTGLNKTTVYRLLQTMLSCGWLTRTKSGSYRLGMPMLYLGAIARGNLDLRNEAVPLMRRLSEEFGDTSFLMIPGPHGAVTIELVVGRNPVRIHGVTVGSVLPYHVAAGPVAIAAFTPEIEARVLESDPPRLTSHTVSSRADLTRYFARVREAGYVVSFEDYIEDVAAVAAPVLNGDGIAIAALSLGGPASRFQDPMLSRAVDRVCAMARELSDRMSS
jgi:DNA-binding IclR family transcriptional regulator